jgi:hypothetical protein
MKMRARWNWPRIVSSAVEFSVFASGVSVFMPFMPNPSFLCMVYMIFWQCDHY